VKVLVQAERLDPYIVLVDRGDFGRCSLLVDLIALCLGMLGDGISICPSGLGELLPLAVHSQEAIVAVGSVRIAV
jgi:hypothetical protein